LPKKHHLPLEGMDKILKKYWGYASFRPQQGEIIESVLSGKDTLALMPTGGGKSICYQVPALAREGLCLVISPLIALMKDQVYHLKRKGIIAQAVFSGMSYREIDVALDNCIYGNVKLLYISPERLKTELFRTRLQKMKINLLAVDEAHCISQWGYDFRPPYLEIAEIRELLPGVPVLALTASATPDVQDDIQEKLKFKQKHVFKLSFKRERLSYVVIREENKPGKLIQILQKVPGSAIVYVRNRRKTKEAAEIIQKAGITASYYHAGLKMEERNLKQEKWIQNRIRVICCTNAFGMGIDKPDVRTVIHLDLPDSPEAYYQEAGRAGRDGKRSYAVVLYNKQNLTNLKTGLSSKFPEMKFIVRVYSCLCDYYQLAIGSGEGESYNFDLNDFCMTYRLEIRRTFSALKILEQQGLILLNDAFFMGPRVKVIASRQTLYHLEVKKPKLELIIKTILRTYEGAFDQYVKIDEKKMAGKLNMTVPGLQKAFKELKKGRYIFYEPFNDKPQVVFVLGRQDKFHHYGIDFKKIEARKKIAENKTGAMLFYATNRVKCRQRVLLEYFGETDTTPCGICDVCLSKKTKGLDEEGFEVIFEKLKQKLLNQALQVRKLVDLFPEEKAENIVFVVRWMLDNDVVVEKEDKITWAKEKE
jgi:ATP-dependent DNA helicase RecQ